MSSGAASVVEPSPGRFFADPFLMSDGDRSFVFFEDYSYRADKGVISYVEILGEGQYGDPMPALERPFHLSYPMMFRWNDEIFMIPESHHNRAIELYRAERFPDVWVLEKVLFSDIHAFDSTILQQEDRWWLFTAVTRPGEFDYRDLYLFHAADPLGPWVEHPQNPVVSDRSRARPAGMIGREDDSLVRPGQDCSRSYGRAVVFNRIEELTPIAYRESPFRRLGPRLQGSRATHTYNRDDSYEATDGLRLVRKN